MMMKKIVMMFIAAGTLASCSKKDDDKSTPAPVAGTEVRISDLAGAPQTPGDPTGAKPDTVFFSFKAADKVTTQDQWDIAFTGIYNSSVISNVKENIWMNVQQKEFAAVTTLPVADYSLSSIGSNSTSPNGWYKYDITTHVVTALGGRTILIKKKDGTVYKLEMISIYKGNPSKPTMETPAPFLHFRYAVFA
jgi:hypothetical protein